MKKVCLVFLLGLFLFVGSSLLAATITVPGDYSSITAAIAAAVADDTIDITAVGPYDEVITIDKPLTIRGVGVRPNLCVRLNAAGGGGGDDGLVIAGFTGTCNLENLNIIPSRTSTPGAIDGSDGILVRPLAGETVNLNMDSLVVCPNDGTDNPVTLDGLAEVDLTSATAFGDDGIFFTGVDATAMIIGNMTNCIISNNRNGIANADGLVIGKTLTIGPGCVISYNYRIGVQYSAAQADITIAGTPENPVKVIGNKSISSAQGGLALFNGTGKVTHCIIADNASGIATALSATPGGLGFTSISSTLFIHNLDGIHLDDSAAIHSAPLTINNCTFANNTQSAIDIGAANANTTVTIIDCVIAGNGDATNPNNVILNNSVNTTVIQNCSIVTDGLYSFNTTVANFDGTSGTGPFAITSFINANPNFQSVSLSDLDLTVAPISFSGSPGGVVNFTASGGKYFNVTNTAYATAASGGNPLSGGAGYAPSGAHLNWSSSSTTIASLSTASDDTATFDLGPSTGSVTVTALSVNGQEADIVGLVSPTSTPMVTDQEKTLIRTREIQIQ